MSIEVCRCCIPVLSCLCYLVPIRLWKLNCGNEITITNRMIRLSMRDRSILKGKKEWALKRAFGLELRVKGMMSLADNKRLTVTGIMDRWYRPRSSDHTILSPSWWRALASWSGPSATDMVRARSEMSGPTTARCREDGWNGELYPNTIVYLLFETQFTLLIC